MTEKNPEKFQRNANAYKFSSSSNHQTCMLIKARSLLNLFALRPYRANVNLVGRWCGEYKLCPRAIEHTIPNRAQLRSWKAVGRNITKRGKGVHRDGVLRKRLGSIELFGNSVVTNLRPMRGEDFFTVWREVDTGNYSANIQLSWIQRVRVSVLGVDVPKPEDAFIVTGGE